MAHTFLSPPSKRPLMADPNPNGKAAKRSKSKQPPPPLLVPAGHVALRMLCHASLVGGFIGKSGAAIKQLQVDTGSKIRVEDSLRPGSDDRVIVIIAASTPLKKYEGEEYEVSAVQEAAIRVFEKVLEVSGEMNGAAETATCRFLVDAVQAGSVIGKGGKVVEKMRKESGAKVRVLLGDQLPPGVSSPDEVVEIEGVALAVKKALLGVCGRLQECPQGEKSSIKESRPLESTSQPTAPGFRVDPPLLQRTPVSAATTSSSPASVERPFLFEADKLTTSDSKLLQQDVVFRILCSNDIAGGIIGRGGSIVRALQDETGASINIGPAVANGDDRLVTITSKEFAIFLDDVFQDVESRYSPAQRAVILVFSRSVETGVEKGFEPGLSKSSSVSARLVVSSNQAGCLLGRGGVIISQMRKETGAGISIIRGDQVPKCASEDDEVVEISGQFVNVQDALYQVTGRLRSNYFASKGMNMPGSWTNTSVGLDPSLHERVGDRTSIDFHQSSGTSQYFDRHASIWPSLGPLLRPHRLDSSPSPGLRTSQMAAGVSMRTSMNYGRGLISANGVDLGSEYRPAIVTNTAVEILVPESAINAVYGDNGSNLARIRQISGAKVVVHEAHHGSRDRTVVISGTPDETQAAQSLLHAFILTAPS